MYSAVKYTHGNSVGLLPCGVAVIWCGSVEDDMAGSPALILWYTKGFCGVSQDEYCNASSMEQTHNLSILSELYDYSIMPL